MALPWQQKGVALPWQQSLDLPEGPVEGVRRTGWQLHTDFPWAAAEQGHMGCS